jgi:polysaccharide biosynthesis transport protein
MNATHRDEPYALTLLRAIGRRWLLVLACAIIVPAAALGLTLTQEKKYSATASLLFRDPGFDTTLFGSDFFTPTVDPAREGQTNAELVSLSVISLRTAKTLDAGTTAKEVEKAVDVQPGTDADVIAVEATDPDPDRAALIANTYADQYVAFRREADRQKVEDARRLVETEVEQLSAADQAGPRGEQLRQRVSELRVLSALQTGNAEVVQNATVPSQPSSPRPKRNTALGLILGIVLGSGLAIFLDRADRRMRTSEEVSELFELPLVAAIPRSRALRRGERGTPLEREGVAFQMLRTNLRYFNVDKPMKSVMVTSAAAGDGKSTVAWYLAAVEAMAGQRVLLIEADLRNPALHELIGITPTRGLAEVLAGQLELPEAVQAVSALPENESGDGAWVDVLLAGWKPPNPAQLIESDRMRDMLRDAEEEYDVVIVDTPPLPVVSDAIPLVSRVSGVVVVVRLGKNTRNGLVALKDQLVNLGAPTLGVVVNDIGSRTESYDGYGYGMDGGAKRPKRGGRARRGAARSGAGQKS